tara:strand:+ start:16 stop:510 length:495 start_codon:yes stop_codon:yes gene_type:complete
MINRDQIYWFYKNKKTRFVEIDTKFSIKLFTPNLMNLKLHNEKFFLYFFWYIFTFGRYRIFYIIDDENKSIAHYSIIIPKIFKYSFMKRNDWQIVNVFTYELYRRNSLYQFALANILLEYNSINLWIGTRSDNVAGVKAIEKAGFNKIIEVKKKGFFGIYKVHE